MDALLSEIRRDRNLSGSGRSPTRRCKVAVSNLPTFEQSCDHLLPPLFVRSNITVGASGRLALRFQSIAVELMPLSMEALDKRAQHPNSLDEARR
jgi:hypothetical protein